LQPRGALAETPLTSLLETAQGEKSTGTLILRNGSGHTMSLYFVFGQLVHAVGDGVAGDEAVVKALSWPGGEFEFDPKAKLPPDETVKADIPELVRKAEAAAKSGAHEHPKADPAETKAERRDHAEPERKVEAPQPRRGVKHRPQPKHGREPIPVPAGQVIYDSLKTSFVDFPRLITTLEKEQYTGYVRLLTDDASGLILFREGLALECMYDGGGDPQLVLGKPALQHFNDDVLHGQGVLDVVCLTPELIDGLYELTVSKPMYTELYASWVDMKALLKFLADRKFSGSVMIRSGAGTGVIILAEGDLAGAYTSESRDIADKPDRALALCDDPGAMIEVKSADATPHAPLDVEEVVKGQRPARPSPVPAPAAVAAAPAPPPPPPPAPVRENPPTVEVPVMQPEPVASPPTASFQSISPPTASFQVPSSTRMATPQVATGGPQLDWGSIVAELQAMAEDSLGNRARKVKDILGAADPTLAGIEGAIDQIPSISLLFVDSSRLEQLAQEMRIRLKSHL
jgi:hypothetical protein